MALSNLPPGVTDAMIDAYFGAEWEGQMHRTCERDVSRKFVTPEADRLLKILKDPTTAVSPGWMETRGDLEKVTMLQSVVSRTLEALLREIGSTEEFESICEWSGDVDCTIEGGQVFWVCPRCGHDWQQDAAGISEPDPDDAYDRWRENQMDGEVE